MLRSLSVLLDYHLAAIDGVQGTVQDFLFDEETWIVHYLVAETASPLGKRRVLILPFAAGQPDCERKRLAVGLTCQQIRTSPPLEADMPVSRQYESGLKQPGSHLRSAREVIGYRIHAKDGELGTFEDFIIEDTLWGVHSVVIGLKQPPRRSVLLPPESIRSFSWPGKAAWVNLSLREMAKKPNFDPAAPVNHDSEHRVYDYYGRPVYSIPPPAGSESAPRQH
ncbi:MAG TPA: hypothetical protein VGN17_02945 [Bryobacteraceae bacterium]|jgi:hypothetical protein